MSTLPRWCVVIPCLDEEAAIRGVVEAVLAQGAPVIVVDDGSTDRTPNILATLPVTVLRHATRRGKGQALRHGFREALRQGYAAVLTMDGDGQHSAADIPRLLAAAAAHPGQIVIGARLLDKAQQPKARRRANAVADWGISWGCGQPVADTQSGQRWYPRAALDLVDLPAQDFVFEAALL
ncbi:MAG TPA: glycosyltransferase family 2 protein, partial [Rhodanobacter sp.]|nr:glycosyltransferase family 2 protein [Rhodanobacter sp.]